MDSSPGLQPGSPPQITRSPGRGVGTIVRSNPGQWDPYPKTGGVPYGKKVRAAGNTHRHKKRALYSNSCCFNKERNSSLEDHLFVMCRLVGYISPYAGYVGLAYAESRIAGRPGEVPSLFSHPLRGFCLDPLHGFRECHVPAALSGLNGWGRLPRVRPFRLHPRLYSYRRFAALRAPAPPHRAKEYHKEIRKS